MMTSVGVVWYLACAGSALWLFLRDMRRLKASLRSPLTNGDVAFSCLLSLLGPIGLAAAIIVTLTSAYGPEATNWASKPSRWQ